MRRSGRSSAYGPTEEETGAVAINSGVNVYDLVGDIGDSDEPRVLGYGRNGGGTTVSMGKARRMGCYCVEDGTGIVCCYKAGSINKD